MKIIDVIPFLLSLDGLEALYTQIDFNSDEDVLCIYMKDIIDIGSDTYFFPISETDDDIIFLKKGIKYIQFFPVEYAFDLINSDLDLNNGLYSNNEIAIRLVQYALKDA